MLSTPPRLLYHRSGTRPPGIPWLKETLLAKGGVFMRLCAKCFEDARNSAWSRCQTLALPSSYDDFARVDFGRRQVAVPLQRLSGQQRVRGTGVLYEASGPEAAERVSLAFCISVKARGQDAVRTGQDSGKPGKLVNIPEAQVKGLCSAARIVFLEQNVPRQKQEPTHRGGDVHGQYHDLLRLFEYGGFPPESNYLFLGDYVDRGKQSLETIILLCSLCTPQVKFPENFFLLRGNHECASITRIYGFYDECKRRYNIKHLGSQKRKSELPLRLWKQFCDVFNCMSVCAIIDEKIICMHGGLSPEITTPDQIKRLGRPTDVPDTGLICDLLWADPDKDIAGWAENDRGVSFIFGPDVVSTFLQMLAGNFAHLISKRLPRT
eukprot:Skav206489  [mRNA]  locus=scaffold1128:101288:119119:+ [translate_table: standard]